MDEKKPGPNNAQILIRGLIGAYLIYMAWHMVQNTLQGLSTMSMPITLVLAGVMALAGLGLVAWALVLAWKSRQ